MPQRKSPPVVRFEPLESRRLLSGATDPSFGDGGRYFADLDAELSENPRDVVVDALDRTYVAIGTYGPNGTSFPDGGVLRLTADGAPDASWGDNGVLRLDLRPGYDSVSSLALDSSDLLYVGGGSERADGTGSDGFLLRLTDLGTIDANFNGGNAFFLGQGPDGGTSSAVQSLALDGEGRIVTLGNLSSLNNIVGHRIVQRFAVADRPLVDDTFGDGGAFTTSDQWYDLTYVYNADHLVVDSQNRVLLAGSIDAETARLLRLTADGELDRAFRSDGELTFSNSDDDVLGSPRVTVDAEDRPILALSERRRNQTHTDRIVLLRYREDGLTDYSFSNDGRDILPVNGIFEKDDVRDVLAKPDGSILVVANSLRSPSTDHSRLLVAKWNGDGLLDADFGDEGLTLTRFDLQETSAYAATLTPGGNIVVAGAGRDPLDTQHVDTLVARFLDAAAAPELVNGAFSYTGSGQSLTFTFDKPLDGNLAVNDLLLANFTTGQSVPADRFSLQLSGDGMTATFTYDTATCGPLPNGNYLATLPADAVRSAAGVPLAADATLRFGFLNADFNGDRVVSLSDFLILRSNFGMASGAIFARGDANYDSRVSLADFLILRANFGTSLPDDDPPTSLFA